MEGDKVSYTHMTSVERRLIYVWRQERIGNNEIARRLARDKETISREVLRNTGGRGYRPKQAQEWAEARALRNLSSAKMSTGKHAFLLARPIGLLEK